MANVIRYIAEAGWSYWARGAANDAGRVVRIFGCGIKTFQREAAARRQRPNPNGTQVPGTETPCPRDSVAGDFRTSVGRVGANTSS